MKTVAQFSSLRRGALDMSVYPLAYAGGEVPEVNIGLMPCLVTTYEQGMAWKTQPIGRELVSLLDKRGVKVVTWIWQAGGTASRSVPVVRARRREGAQDPRRLARDGPDAEGRQAGSSARCRATRSMRRCRREAWMRP